MRTFVAGVWALALVACTPPPSQPTQTPAPTEAMTNAMFAAREHVAANEEAIVRELRDLLEAWRDARRTAWQTTIKVVTTGILAALLVGAAIKLKLMGGVQ